MSGMPVSLDALEAVYALTNKIVPVPEAHRVGFRVGFEAGLELARLHPEYAMALSRELGELNTEPETQEWERVWGDLLRQFPVSRGG